jgi:hypothetical protein
MSPQGGAWLDIFLLIQTWPRGGSTCRGATHLLLTLAPAALLPDLVHAAQQDAHTTLTLVPQVAACPSVLPICRQWRTSQLGRAVASMRLTVDGRACVVSPAATELGDRFEGVFVGRISSSAAVTR